MISVVDLDLPFEELLGEISAEDIPDSARSSQEDRLVNDNGVELPTGDTLSEADHVSNQNTHKCNNGSVLLANVYGDSFSNTDQPIEKCTDYG